MIFIGCSSKNKALSSDPEVGDSNGKSVPLVDKGDGVSIEPELPTEPTLKLAQSVVAGGGETPSVPAGDVRPPVPPVDDGKTHSCICGWK